MGRNGLFIMIVIVLMAIGGYALFRNKVDSPAGPAPASTEGAPPAEAPAPATAP